MPVSILFFQPAEQFFLEEILDHRLTEAVGVDVTLTRELGCDLLHFGVNLWILELEAFRFCQGREGKTAAQALLRFRA